MPLPQPPRYIQDADLAQAAGEFSALWSKIGADADHPLTEYFVRRYGRPGMLRALAAQFDWIIGISIYKLIAVLMFLTLVTGFGWFWIAPLGIAIAVALERRSHLRRLRASHSMASPLNILSGQQRGAAIWMSGLKVQELVGIVALYDYWRARNLCRSRRAMCILISIANFAAFYVLFLMKNERYWIFVNLIPLGIVAMNFLADPAMVLHGSLCRLSNMLEPHSAKFDKRDLIRHGYSLYFTLLVLLVEFYLMIKGAPFWWYFFLLFGCIGIEWFKTNCAERIEDLYYSLLCSEKAYDLRLAPGQDESEIVMGREN